MQTFDVFIFTIFKIYSHPREFSYRLVPNAVSSH